MLDTRGNTAVYLQFAHARLASILSKARDELHVDLAALKASPELVSVEHDAERALAFELLMFSDVIEVSYEYFWYERMHVSIFDPSRDPFRIRSNTRPRYTHTL